MSLVTGQFSYVIRTGEGPRILFLLYGSPHGVPKGTARTASTTSLLSGLRRTALSGVHGAAWRSKVRRRSRHCRWFRFVAKHSGLPGWPSKGSSHETAAIPELWHDD